MVEMLEKCLVFAVYVDSGFLRSLTDHLIRSMVNHLELDVAVNNLNNEE